MSMTEGMNIVDGALNLALGDLESRGIAKDEAQIALLIRLRSVVPADVSKIADILNEDPEVLSAINGLNEIKEPTHKTA